MGRGLLDLALLVLPADLDLDLRPAGRGVVRLELHRLAGLGPHGQQSRVDQARPHVGHHHGFVTPIAERGKELQRPIRAASRRQEDDLLVLIVDPDGQFRVERLERLGVIDQRRPQVDFLLRLRFFLEFGCFRGRCCLFRPGGDFLGRFRRSFGRLLAGGGRLGRFLPGRAPAPHHRRQDPGGP